MCVILCVCVCGCQMPASGCFTTDDMWITGWLAMTGRGVDRVVIPEDGLMHKPSPFQKNDISKYQLSSFNSKNLQDIKCIDGVGERFHAPWKTVAGTSSSNNRPVLRAEPR